MTGPRGYAPIVYGRLGDGVVYEIDESGHLRRRLSAMTREQRRLVVARTIEKLEPMAPGWYRGLDRIVAELDDADLEREIGAEAEVAARAAIEAAKALGRRGT